MSDEEPKPQWPKNEAQSQAFMLYCAGFEEPEISERTGINRNTLATWKHRGNWKALQEEFRKAKDEKDPKLVEKMIVASGEPREKIVERFNRTRENMADKVARHIDNLDGEEIVIDSRNIDTALKMSERGLGLDKEEEKGGNISLTFLTGDAGNAVRIIENKPATPAVEDSDWED